MLLQFSDLYTFYGTDTLIHHTYIAKLITLYEDAIERKRSEQFLVETPANTHKDTCTNQLLGLLHTATEAMNDPRHLCPQLLAHCQYLVNGFDTMYDKRLADQFAQLDVFAKDLHL